MLLEYQGDTVNQRGKRHRLPPGHSPAGPDLETHGPKPGPFRAGYHGHTFATVPQLPYEPQSRAFPDPELDRVHGDPRYGGHEDALHVRVMLKPVPHGPTGGKWPSEGMGIHSPAVDHCGLTLVPGAEHITPAVAQTGTA